MFQGDLFHCALLYWLNQTGTHVDRSIIEDLIKNREDLGRFIWIHYLKNLREDDDNLSMKDHEEEIALDYTDHNLENMFKLFLLCTVCLAQLSNLTSRDESERLQKRLLFLNYLKDFESRFQNIVAKPEFDLCSIFLLVLFVITKKIDKPDFSLQEIVLKSVDNISEKSDQLGYGHLYIIKSKELLLRTFRYYDQTRVNLT